MHTTKSFVLTAASSLAVAAFVLTLAAVRSDAHPHEPPPVQLKSWIKSTGNRDLAACPMTPTVNNPAAPYFSFTGMPQSCLVDGPYKWDHKDWYVQRINGLQPVAGGPIHELIRVCSLSAVRPAQPATFVGGPCHTAAGVGPRGCEICVMDGVPQP